MHTFPIDSKSTYEWTEFFKTFEADPVAMHAADYEIPLQKVADWMTGPDGVSKAQMDSIDTFFKGLAQITPKQSEIVVQGMPWGGLEEYVHLHQR
jgi:hypothetical protein